MQVQLTPSRDSGVSGSATFEDVKGGVKVTLQMQNLPEPGIKHINTSTRGTCADDRAGRTAPVTIPLKTITAQDDGTGSATTTIEDVSVAQLFGEDKERFILLHAEAKKGEGVPPGIACADLAPLAETGGIRPAPLFLAGAISVLGVAEPLDRLARLVNIPTVVDAFDVLLAVASRYVALREEGKVCGLALFGNFTYAELPP